MTRRSDPGWVHPDADHQNEHAWAQMIERRGAMLATCLLSGGLLAVIILLGWAVSR